MRAMDVPARIVTGYQGGGQNSLDGYWTVRQSDAHAWAEVWIAERGWVRVDPTGAVAPGRVGAFERLPIPQGAIASAVGNVIGANALQQMRAREIATMRAIGFRGLPVVTAVMLETMLLALLGGLLGCAVAWLLFNGYSVSTIGSNFSAVVFKFHVSPELLWTGLKWALGIGLVGGLFPALRAARLPITTALRET